MPLFWHTPPNGAIPRGKEVVPKQIAKTVYAKKIRFKAGRHKDFQPEPIEELLTRLQQIAPTWSKRHWPVVPDEGRLEPGVACAFIRRIVRRHHGDEKGLYFEVGSYTNGHAPDQMELDFNADEPDITTEPVRDAQGRVREIVIICRCVALGETLIVENVMGSGGVGGVQKLLSRLFSHFLTYGDARRKYPTIELLDVTSADLRTAILRGRGVRKVFLRMVEGADPGDDGWAAPLKSSKHRFRNAEKFAAIWESSDNEILNTDDVVAAVDDSMEEDSALDKITLELNDGNKLTGLGSYKARSQVYVTMDNAGVLHYSELIEGLWSYLDELRISRNNWRLINDDGFFNAHAPVIIQDAD